MGCEEPEKEADRIFAIADLDENGYLEFNEWCVATMDKKQMLKRPRLWAAFKLLDNDESGKISYDEVKRMLSEDSTLFSDEDFKKMITDIDIDGDGEIDFEEFEKMMIMLVTDNKPGGKLRDREIREAEARRRSELNAKKDQNEKWDVLNVPDALVNKELEIKENKNSKERSKEDLNVVKMASDETSKSAGIDGLSEIRPVKIEP